MQTTATNLARRLLGVTLALDVFWVASYLILVAAGPGAARLLKVMDLDAEANPPSWWSGSQLLVIGLVFLLLVVRPFSDDSRIRPILPALWTLGLGFVFLSADEIGGIHESLAGILRGQSVIPTFRGQGVWLFIYAAIGIAIALTLSGYARRAWRSWRRECVIAAAGLGIMLLGGALVEVIGYFMELSSSRMFIEIAVEEFGEMIGASLILYAATRMLAAVGSSLLAASDARRSADLDAVG